MATIRSVTLPAPIDDESRRFIIRHRGRQIGKPHKTVKAAIQRSYEILADIDMTQLSRKEKEQLVHDIVAI